VQLLQNTRNPYRNDLLHARHLLPFRDFDDATGVSWQSDSRHRQFVRELAPNP